MVSQPQCSCHSNPCTCGGTEPTLALASSAPQVSTTLPSAPQVSTTLPYTAFNVGIIQSAVFGGVTGTFFDDSDTAGGALIMSNEMAGIDVNRPISKIVVRWGAVIDGIWLTYNISDGQDPVTKEHGVNHTCTDPTLQSTTIDIHDNEEIIAICGRAGFKGPDGKPDRYGNRIRAIGFVIWNRTTCSMRLEPQPRPNQHGESHLLGGMGGEPFRVTANGSFIAIAGYAQNQKPSVKDAGDKGGLYGLKFVEVNYRKV